MSDFHDQHAAKMSWWCSCIEAGTAAGSLGGLSNTSQPAGH